MIGTFEHQTERQLGERSWGLRTADEWQAQIEWWRTLREIRALPETRNR